MKPQPPLVGADGAVHLDPESPIDMNMSLVVLPWHAEHQDALGFHQSLDDPRATVLRPSLENEIEWLDDLLDRLVKLRLRRILGLQVGHYVANNRRLGRGQLQLENRHGSSSFSFLRECSLLLRASSWCARCYAMWQSPAPKGAAATGAIRPRAAESPTCGMNRIAGNSWDEGGRLRAAAGLCNRPEDLDRRVGILGSREDPRAVERQ